MSHSLQDEFIKKELLHGAQNYSPLSVVLEKGKGVYLWDVDGNKYLDMVSAYSAVSHGHSHPELVKTIKNQSEKLAITSRAFYTEPFANFLESLTNMSGFEILATSLDESNKSNLDMEVIRDGPKFRKFSIISRRYFQELSWLFG